MKDKPRKQESWLKKIIDRLAIGLLLFLFLLFFGAASPFPGYELKVVISGSMEPTIPTGSVVVIYPQENYEKGDIITFSSEDQFITHRIAEVSKKENQTSFLTAGDANDAVDSSKLKKEKVLGEAVLIIPFLGYLMEFIQTDLGLVTLFFLGLFLIFDF